MATYQRPRSTRVLVLALLVTSLVTITVDFRSGERGPLAAIGRFGAGVIAPLQEGVSAIVRPVGGFFSTLFRAGSLKEQNAALEAQLKELAGDIPYSTALFRENEALRSLLEVGNRLEFDVMGATVTSGGVSNFEWAVWVDKGSDDGVYLDQPVITGSGALGHVVKLTPSASKVMLLIDPESKIAVRLASSGKTGVLVGQRDEDLRIDLIPPDTEVPAGERVITATYGPGRSIFPPGVPVGEVSKVVPAEGGYELQVYVRPSVDFSTLEFVGLIRDSAPRRAVAEG